MVREILPEKYGFVKSMNRFWYEMWDKNNTAISDVLVWRLYKI